MSIHLQRDLDRLEQAIVDQAALVDRMIQQACCALWDRKPMAARGIMKLEEEVNLREVEIEEECLKALALHQPVAIDLRRIATVLKINNDLERVGDLSVNILEGARVVADWVDLEPPESLRSLAELSRHMVRRAMRAFVTLSTKIADEVCKADDEADDFHAEVRDLMQVFVQSHPQTVEPAVGYIALSRDMERIADHATNIAEDVLYLVDGEIHRHGREFRQPA